MHLSSLKHPTPAVQVPFGVDDVPVGFKLHSRIVGTRHYLLKNIMRESGAEMIRLGSFKPQAQLDSPSVETLSAEEGEGSEPLYISPPSTPSTNGGIAHINSWTSEGQLPSMSEGQLSEGSEGCGGGWSRVGAPRSSQVIEHVSFQKSTSPRDHHLPLAVREDTPSPPPSPDSLIHHSTTSAPIDHQPPFLTTQACKHAS